MFINLVFVAPDYTLLAARIVVANLHKETKKVFSEVMADLYNMMTHDRPTPMISKTHHDIIQKHAERLNSAIVYDRDFNYQVRTLICSNILAKYGMSMVIKGFNVSGVFSKFSVQDLKKCFYLVSWKKFKQFKLFKLCILSGKFCFLALYLNVND